MSSSPPDPLIWEGNDEWYHSDVRGWSGMAASDHGPWNEDQLRMGIDIEHDFFGSAEHYWPFEDDPTAENNYTADIINGADIIYKRDPRRAISGANGTNAPNFNGTDQGVGFGSVGNFDHGGEFAMAIMLDTQDDRSLRTIFHTGQPFDAEGAILVDTRDGPRIAAHYRSQGEWLGATTFHDDGNFTLGEPHWIVVTLNEAPNNEWRLSVWLDGHHQWTLLPRNRPALSPDNSYGAIGCIWYDRTRWMSGVFDDLMYFDNGLVYADEIEHFEAAYEDAFWRSRWKSADAQATSVTFDHEIPDDTELTINIIQRWENDAGGYDQMDLTGTILPDQSTYPLSGFQDRVSEYSVEVLPETDNLYNTPVVESIELTMESLPDTGVWDTVDTNGVLESVDGVIQTV